jgi:hypothetical protein
VYPSALSLSSVNSGERRIANERKGKSEMGGEEEGGEVEVLFKYSR